MTKCGPKLHIVLLKSPVKLGWMLFEESLPFPSLLSWPDSHGQTEVRVNFKVTSYRSKYLLTKVIDMIGTEPSCQASQQYNDLTQILRVLSHWKHR